MLIGEIVKKTGFSKDTIRFYEKHGLIKIGKKERRNNNYKEYSDQILDRLLTIKRLKGLGFTLNEIVELLDMIEYQEANCTSIKDKINNKVNLLDEKINQLIKLRAILLKGASQCKDNCSPEEKKENCAVLISDHFIC